MGRELTLPVKPLPYFCTQKISYYSIYRCIDDSDDEGFSFPFNCDYYYNLIPEEAFKLAIKAKSDSNVTDWIRSHLIKGQSDSPDDVIAFLDENGIPCKFGWTYQCEEG